MPNLYPYKRPATFYAGMTWREWCDREVERLKSLGRGVYVKTIWNQHQGIHRRYNIRCTVFERIAAIRKQKREKQIKV